MNYTGENYTLHLGDSARVLASFPADSIDLTVTSPPYDNLRDYGKDFDPTAFNWQTIISELYRVTKPGGVVVWVVADATVNGSESGTSFRQALYAMEAGFNLHDTMIYQKCGSGNPHNDGRFGSSFEYMFIFSKGRPVTANIPRFPKTNTVATTTRRMKNGTTKKGTYNVGGGVLPNIRRYAGDTKQPHPAAFPEALARDHILSWSNEGDTVLDCFLGSGTTGKMAMILKRKFIGIELDADYLDIANTRIKNAAGEITLTRSEAKKGKQLLPMFD